MNVVDEGFMVLEVKGVNVYIVWPGKPIQHLKKLHNVTSVVINCHHESNEKSH